MQNNLLHLHSQCLQLCKPLLTATDSCSLLVQVVAACCVMQCLMQCHNSQHHSSQQVMPEVPCKPVRCTGQFCLLSGCRLICTLCSCSVSGVAWLSCAFSAMLRTSTTSSGPHLDNFVNTREQSVLQGNGHQVHHAARSNVAAISLHASRTHGSCNYCCCTHVMRRVCMPAVQLHTAGPGSAAVAGVHRG